MTDDRPILTGMSVPAPTSAEPAGQGIAVPAAVGLIVAAVVAALALVGLVVSLDSDKLPTGPAMAPPPAPVPEVSYDSLLRTARYDNIRVSMPGNPYECPDSPGQVPPVLASGILCNATVHPEYDGSSDWAASAAFGSVPDDLTRPTAEGTAKAVFQQWRSAAFGKQDTTLSDYGTEKVDLGGQPVTLVHGNVHYTVKGVPSSYDRVVVVALPARSGGYAAYISSRPDDTPKATLDKLDRSLNTLRYET